MNKINAKSNQLYEKEGVFGDEDKYIDASHRFVKMMEIIKALEIKKNNILDIFNK